ncbi:MAG: hypothetical protein IJ381_05150 [Clostridia bacterium]|nr:hypothetical protein [Clostridia bacterium]
MDDIISMIVVFIIYCAASAMGGKKKKKKSRDRMRRQRHIESVLKEIRGMNEARQAAEPAHQEILPQMQTKREAPLRAETEAGNTVRQPCGEASGMHLHSVTQAQMHAAGEGEDPCHHGDASAFEMEDSPIYDQEKAPQTEALMQDMLRGVIMSEILTRPCEKRAMYRNGRRA